MRRIKIVNHKLALFEEKEIRKIYKNNKWYYSITDVISMMTDTKEPNQYLKKIKLKEPELEKDWDNICIKINMQTKDGKIRKTQTSDTMGILRIIESISSPKAETFKRWLAKIGSERLEEINNPELAMDRMKQIYEYKGYSNAWIEQREREITTRHSLTEEWEIRGSKENQDYIILMNEIYKSGLGIDSEQYKDIKGIKETGILKDSMTNLELALINLGEVTTIEIHKKNNSYGIEELKKDIDISGEILNKTKKEIERNLEKNIISPENYMNLTYDK